MKLWWRSRAADKRVHAQAASRYSSRPDVGDVPGQRYVRPLHRVVGRACGDLSHAPDGAKVAFGSIAVDARDQFGEAGEGSPIMVAVGRPWTSLMGGELTTLHQIFASRNPPFY